MKEQEFVALFKRYQDLQKCINYTETHENWNAFRAVSLISEIGGIRLQEDLEKELKQMFVTMNRKYQDELEELCKKISISN